MAAALGIAPQVGVAHVQRAASNKQTRVDRTCASQLHHIVSVCLFRRVCRDVQAGWVAIEHTVSRTHTSTAVDFGAMQHLQSFVEEQQAGRGRVVANVPTQVGIATLDHSVWTSQAVSQATRPPPPPPPTHPSPPRGRTDLLFCSKRSVPMNSMLWRRRCSGALTIVGLKPNPTSDVVEQPFKSEQARTTGQTLPANPMPTHVSGQPP